MLPFVNPKKEGYLLFTRVDLIHNYKLNREKPLANREITDPVQPGFLGTLSSHPFNSFEQWRSILKLQFYKQLFGHKEFFNDNGIAFDVWKDDCFQADAMIAVFKEACETFKREVGPKFKGFEELSKKLEN